MSISAIHRDAAIRHVQRVSGQVSALGGMVGTRRPFAEVAQQLLAARGSLDSLLVRLVEIELDECLASPAARDQVDDLLRAALGRGGPARAYGRRAATGWRPSHIRTGGTASS